MKGYCHLTTRSLSHIRGMAAIRKVFLRTGVHPGGYIERAKGETFMRHCRRALADQSRWLWLILLALISQHAWGASREIGWSVRTWPMVDGSNNSVAGVVQTPDGYLWVATSAGMNQFDGVHFEHF